VDFARSESDDIIAEDDPAAVRWTSLRPAASGIRSRAVVSKAVRDSYAMLGFEGFDLPEDAGGAGLGMLSPYPDQPLARRSRCRRRARARSFAPAVYVIEAFGGVAALKPFAAMLGALISGFCAGHG